MDEVVGTFAELPAKVGLVTAGLLLILANGLPRLLGTPGTLAASMSVAASYVAWFLALLVLLGVVIGVIRGWLDRRRFDSFDIDQLTWTEFESYLAEYYRRCGASVTRRGGGARDGGVDLVLDEASGRRIVQAKHWKERRVGVVALRALWGVLHDERAQGAVFVTSGSFTPDATSFARGKRLELIDGPKLRRLVAEMRKSTGAVALTESDVCPKCGRGRLQRKLARRGAHAGSYFRGCDRYPACNYIRNIVADASRV